MRQHDRLGSYGHRVDDEGPRRLTRRAAAGGLVSSLLLARSLRGQAFDEDGRPIIGPDGLAVVPDTPPIPYTEEVASGAGGSCVLVPNEIEGPYYVDLEKNHAAYRIDMREDQLGIPLQIDLRVLDVRNGCRPVRGARVDIWHCDRNGVYSGVANLKLGPTGRDDDTRGQTYLRGVQLTDRWGRVKFRSIYPGWYPPRLTHIHVEIFVGDILRTTTQLALPQEITRAVYDTPHYRSHGQNVLVPDLAHDVVFKNHLATHQMFQVAGDLRRGFRASLDMGIVARG